jgi:hypothetical protein
MHSASSAQKMEREIYSEASVDLSHHMVLLFKILILYYLFDLFIQVDSTMQLSNQTTY